MRRMAIAVLGASLLVALVPATAPAVDHHQPPRIRIFAGQGSQPGDLGSYCWSWTNPSGGGEGVCADGAWSFPDRILRAPAGSHAVLRIRRQERPQDLSLRGYRELDRHGQPRDEGDRIPIGRVRRMLRDGELRGWRARIHLPAETGDLYLDLFGEWGPGSADYTFHLKLR